MWTTLGDAFRWGSGGTPRSSLPAYYGGGIPWAVIGDLNDAVVRSTAQTISEAGLAASSAKWVEAGSVLLAMYGSIGKLGLAGMKLTTNQAIAFCDPRPVDARYLFWYLYSSRSRLSRLGKGGTQQNISQTVIKDVPFPLAPAAEQRRIVDEVEKQFTRLDAAVAAIERVKANLKRYRASVLKAACEGRLVPTEAELARREGRSFESGEELLGRILKARRARWETHQLAKPGTARRVSRDDRWQSKYREPEPPEGIIEKELPPGWCFTSAEAVCASVADGTHDTPAYVVEGVPLVTSKNLLSTGLSLEDVKLVSTADHRQISRRSGVQQGDMLFAMIGTVGNPCVVSGPAEFSIKNVGLFRRNPGLLSMEYLRNWFRSPRFCRWLEAHQKGTTQKFVPLVLLRRLPVLLPPISEQHRIVAEVERRLSVVDELEATVERNLARCTRLRQSILKKAFEGRLVPQDPNDEPASVLLERIRSARSENAPPGRPPRDLRGNRKSKGR